MAQTATPVRNEEITTRELQQQISTLRDDISQLTETVTKYGKAQARAGINSVREAGAQRLSQAEDFATRTVADTEEYVRTHPAASVGMAAGLGFLVGLMTTRR